MGFETGDVDLECHSSLDSDLIFANTEPKFAKHCAHPPQSHPSPGAFLQFQFSPLRSIVISLRKCSSSKNECHCYQHFLPRVQVVMPTVQVFCSLFIIFSAQFVAVPRICAMSKALFPKFGIYLQLVFGCQDFSFAGPKSQIKNCESTIFFA